MKKLFLFSLIFSAFFSLASVAKADTIYNVTPSYCSGTGVCTSSTCSIEAAIWAANADTVNDSIINIPAGNYRNCNMLYINNANTKIILQGNSQSTTALFFDPANYIQVGPYADFEVNDLRIANGLYGLYIKHDAVVSLDEVGIHQTSTDGVYVDSADVEMSNMDIAYNYNGITSNQDLVISNSNVNNNDQYGINFSGSNLDVSNSTLNSNGLNGIYSNAVQTTIAGSEMNLNTYSGLTIENGQASVVGCDINGNTASGINALYADLTISDSTIENNMVRFNYHYSGLSNNTNGGGLSLYETEATIYGSEINNNFSFNQGGGIFVDYQSHLNVRTTSFIANQATDKGGAIMFERGSGYEKGVITQSLFNENISPRGAAIYNDAFIYLDNSTISGNQTSQMFDINKTGIIHNEGVLLLAFCTISDNVFIRGYSWIL